MTIFFLILSFSNFYLPLYAESGTLQIPFFHLPQQMYNHVKHSVGEMPGKLGFHQKHLAKHFQDSFSNAVFYTQLNETKCDALSKEKVKQCADPLYQIGAIESQNDTLSRHFLSPTKAYLSEVCDNILVFDMCIEPYKNKCFGSDAIKLQYDTALEILNFLCRDGYGEVMQYLECFTRILTRAEMMQCQTEMVSDFRKIPDEMELGKTVREAAICGTIRNYVDCVKYPIRYECGYRAWQFISELIIRPSKTLIPRCQLNSARQFAILIIVPLLAHLLV